MTTPVDKEACTYSNIFLAQPAWTTQQQCENFARKKCAKEEDLINFYSLHFCLMNGSSFSLIIFSVLFITFNFRWLSVVVEEYLAEGITRISSYLGFSEALAACTLLAFANGAGDIFTALVAGGHSSQGVFYNIGSLYGAGLFCCCNVVGVAVYLNRKDYLKFDSSIIYRDVSFYILATLVIIGFGVYGEISILTAIILLGLYVLQVVVVLIQQCRQASKEECLFLNRSQN